MRAFVTGGSGFLGPFVIRRLVDAGHNVVALARSESAAATVTTCGARAIRGDLRHASLDDAMRSSNADVLVNLASVGFGDAPAIIAAAEDAGITRSLFVSTTAIFTTLPAPSKQVRVAAEAEVMASALEWTIVRPTMIYGTPGDRNMWRLLRFLRRTPVVPLPDGGANLQQPVHVDDLAAAIVAAVDAPTAVGQAYDLAGPEALPFWRIVEEASAAVGRRPKLVSVSSRPLLATLQLIERSGKTAPIKAEQVQRLLEDKAFDITAAQRDLGYAPRSFANGIRAEALNRSE